MKIEAYGIAHSIMNNIYVIQRRNTQEPFRGLPSSGALSTGPDWA